MSKVEPEVHLPQALLLFLTSLKKKYALTWIKIFGSRARGDHHENSDVDVAYKCSKESFKTFEISEEVENNKVSLLIIDLVNFDEISNSEFKNKILKEGVNL